MGGQVTICQSIPDPTQQFSIGKTLHQQNKYILGQENYQNQDDDNQNTLSKIMNSKISLNTPRIASKNAFQNCIIISNSPLRNNLRTNTTPILSNIKYDQVVINQQKCTMKSSKEIYEPIKILQETFIKTYKIPITTNYIIQQKIGEGSFGNVFRAICLRTKQQRAIKIMKNRSVTQHQKKSFLKEMELLSELDHPNIVKLYEMYDYNNSFYAVMEYCKGGPLNRHILHRQNYSQQKIKTVMRQLFQAVKYLHSLKIVHRDLKLQNMVLLEPVGSSKNINIKIIDFGTAEKMKYKRNHCDRMVGTISYVAPEVINGYYTQKCDIWACGIIFNILLTGISPFKALKKTDIIQNIKNQQINFKSGIYNIINPSALNLLTQMLIKDPNARISSEKVLMDQWIQQEIVQKEKKQPISLVMQNINDYYRSNSLVSLVQCLLVHKRVSQSYRKDLGQIFTRLDKDRSGKLDTKELMIAFRDYSHQQMSQGQIQRIISNISKSKTDKIGFSEFLAVAYGKESLFIKEWLLDAFEHLDIDKTGFIEKKQLREALYGCQNRQFDFILNKIDTNKDQKLSKEEFVDYFTSLNL